MTEASSEYEIPRLEPCIFYGLSTEIQGNVHFLSDSHLLHPAGKVLVIDDITDGSQRFIKLPPSRKQISIISVSPNRKYVVVGEICERPTLSVYDVSSLERLKLLGIPLKESRAKDWASVSFMQDNEQVVAVSGDPDWTYLIYEWRRGKVLSVGPASQRGLPVLQVIPNREDVTMLALVGRGLFRLMSMSDNVWRQYGFARGEKIPLGCAAWIGPHHLLAGSRDGRLLLLEHGELRALYQADTITQVHLSESTAKVSESVTLASQTVPEENKNGLHEVRAITSFEKGFLYSCNAGEVFVFEKVDKLKWIKRNSIKIPSSLPEEEYRKVFKINFASVNPSNNKVVCTTQKTELYVSQLFKEEETDKGQQHLEFELDGTGYHDGPIVALSTCLWKPIFITAGAHDKTIRLWNYETLKVIITKRFSDEIYSAALHPSGFFCLLGFTDKLRFMLIVVDDLRTVRHVDIRGCRNTAFAGGGHLFAATRAQAIEVYSSITFTRLHTFHGHLGPVTRLVFGANDRCLWSCGAEGSLYEWDMDTGRRLEDIFTNKNGQLGLAVGEAIYSVGTDGKLKEIIKGEISREVDMHQSSLTCATLGNAGQMLFLGGEKSSVVSVFYPLVHPPKWAEFIMHSRPLADIVITHDDRTLITTSEDGFLCIWRIVCSEEKRKDLNGGFGHVGEQLLGVEELEAMRATIRELGHRLAETEGEHEYAIRQMTATSETALRETNTNHTAIIDDLKFRIKQMEREHLVEINKYQTKLKEEQGSHSDAMDQLEKRYSDKLLAELRKIEELETLQAEAKLDLQRVKEGMEEKMKIAITEIEKEKNAVIEEKDEQIREFERKLLKAEDEKRNIKLLLQEEFNNEKERTKEFYELEILGKQKILSELKDENGVLVKTSILLKKDINNLKGTVSKLEDELRKKEEKLKFALEEIEIIKSQLDEKENVIAKKDRLLVKVTKESDVYKRELLYRDTTVEALLQKIAPKDNELKLKECLIEEKNKEIIELEKLCTVHKSEIDGLKKKLTVSENEIKKQKLGLIRIKAFLRKIHLHIYLAASYIYQPELLKNKVIELSEKCFQKRKQEIEEDAVTYIELIKRHTMMEKIIRRFQTKLQKQKPRVKIVHHPYKAFFELLSEFDLITSQLNESTKKVNYLQTLLKLSHKKSNKLF